MRRSYFKRERERETGGKEKRERERREGEKDGREKDGSLKRFPLVSTSRYRYKYRYFMLICFNLDSGSSGFINHSKTSASPLRSVDACCRNF